MQLLCGPGATFSQPRALGRSHVKPRTALTNATATATVGSGGNIISVRRATINDIPELAKFSAQAAVSIEMQQFETLENEALQRMLKLLETRLAESYEQQLCGQLKEALELKQESTFLAREYRLLRLKAKLEAELRLLQGLTASFPRPQTADERRQLAKWRRFRQFQCLVAEDRSTGSAPPLACLSRTEASTSELEAPTQAGSQGGDGGSRPLVGAVTLSMATPEAVLPPPFPSNSPLRVYVSNMGTHPAYRRRGIATALLQACETVGRRWSQASIWLHVDVGNIKAEQLYRKCGYQPVAASSLWLGRQRKLLRKDLKPWMPNTALQQESTAAVMEGLGVKGYKENGVFVWQAAQRQ